MTAEEREMFIEQQRVITELRDALLRVDQTLKYYRESETWNTTALGLWVSSSDPSRPFSPEYIADSYDGFLTELERTGQASATPGSAARGTDPYSTELLPVASLKSIYNAERVKLTRIFACALDSTLVGGGTGQDAATVTDIIASLGTDRAFLQSAYKNGQIAFFQPNFFRPILRVDDEDVLYGNLRQAEIAPGNKAHLSIGLPNPWDSQLNITLGKLTGRKLRAYAQMAQIIPSQSKIQRYTCMIACEFLLGGKVR